MSYRAQAQLVLSPQVLTMLDEQAARQHEQLARQRALEQRHARLMHWLLVQWPEEL